jgi:hypothetical protein
MRLKIRCDSYYAKIFDTFWPTKQGLRRKWDERNPYMHSTFHSCGYRLSFTRRWFNTRATQRVVWVEQWWQSRSTDTQRFVPSDELGMSRTGRHGSAWTMCRTCQGPTIAMTWCIFMSHIVDSLELGWTASPIRLFVLIFFSCLVWYFFNLSFFIRCLFRLIIRRIIWFSIFMSLISFCFKDN